MGLVEAIAIVTPIVSGFIGVWWGGRITMKSAAEARQHQDRRARELELIDLRAASRLVDEQLSNIKVAISESLKQNRWYRLDSTAFNESVWGENRTVLARLLDEDEWHQLRSGVDSAIAFGQLGVDLEGDLVHESQSQLLGSLDKNIEGARDVLRHHRAIGSLVHTLRAKA